MKWMIATGLMMAAATQASAVDLVCPPNAAAARRFVSQLEPFHENDGTRDTTDAFFAIEGGATAYGERISQVAIRLLYSDLQIIRDAPASLSFMLLNDDSARLIPAMNRRFKERCEANEDGSECAIDLGEVPKLGLQQIDILPGEIRCDYN
ncbi:hypothetical protein HL653_14155 [Sphingomonas sp. AP4-R1]|uniref:hypothetical protein n=1 Tax=Sphingomonas sp. AP4-R1 TaxID=2735134 RepID=UPI0014938394|nr:hypothetical protein [Sphingomonas sp. AP4-R1]QJU58756.1 hypothetical protein HL653_14155 [Sphingomonas sp. AP4-R1]